MPSMIKNRASGSTTEVSTLSFMCWNRGAGRVLCVWMVHEHAAFESNCGDGVEYDEATWPYASDISARHDWRRGTKGWTCV